MSNKSRSACSAEEFEKQELRKNSMTSWWTRADHQRENRNTEHGKKF